MSDIQKYPQNGGASFAVYEQLLRRYIAEVLDKLGENDNDITWYICEEGKFPDQHDSKGTFVLEQLSGVIRQPRYGMTIWENGNSHSDIYISTTAIMSAPLHWEKMEEILNIPKKSNLLASVIIDELAHANTHEDHGNKAYEDKLKEYAYKYYVVRKSRRKTTIEERLKNVNLWKRKPGIPWKV